MTQNQVAYHNAVENERHNKMMEKETHRHQRRDEELRAQANAIQERANELQERQIAINQTHYMMSDSEAIRSHQAQEALTAAQQSINLALARETSRHDQAMEWIQRSLNNSVIKRNYAETSVASANAAYIQERTRTQKQETAKTAQQVVNLGQEFKNLVVQYFNTRANTDLARSKVGVDAAAVQQRTDQMWLNYSSDLIRSGTGLISPFASPTAAE